MNHITLREKNVLCNEEIYFLHLHAWICKLSASRRLDMTIWFLTQSLPEDVTIELRNLFYTTIKLNKNHWSYAKLGIRTRDQYFFRLQKIMQLMELNVHFMKSTQQSWHMTFTTGNLFHMFLDLKPTPQKIKSCMYLQVMGVLWPLIACRLFKITRFHRYSFYHFASFSTRFVNLSFIKEAFENVSKYRQSII